MKYIVNRSGVNGNLTLNVGGLSSTALVVALLAATAAAFVLTQGLKSQPSPIRGTKVDDVFSPVCACDTETASIAFRLREADRLDVGIVDGAGDNPLSGIPRLSFECHSSSDSRRTRSGMSPSDPGSRSGAGSSVSAAPTMRSRRNDRPSARSRQ